MLLTVVIVQLRRQKHKFSWTRWKIYIKNISQIQRQYGAFYSDYHLIAAYVFELLTYTYDSRKIKWYLIVMVYNNLSHFTFVAKCLFLSSFSLPYVWNSETAHVHTFLIPKVLVFVCKICSICEICTSKIWNMILLLRGGIEHVLPTRAQFLDSRITLF